MYASKFVLSGRQVFRKYYQNRPAVSEADVSPEVDTERLYDFLYENDFPAPFLMQVKISLDRVQPRSLEEFIMKLHTGETIAAIAPEDTVEMQRLKGQATLFKLAQYFLNNPGSPWINEQMVQELTASLALDGYEHRNGRLLVAEVEVLDVAETRGVLQDLYRTLSLGSEEIAENTLALSESHYISGLWSDSIVNSRKYLECILRDVANAYSERIEGIQLSNDIFSRAYSVRQYLTDHGIFNESERDAIKSIYDLLSHTGAHPYMAENDQARLMRHYAITTAQFVMLRLQGKLASS